MTRHLGFLNPCGKDTTYIVYGFMEDGKSHAYLLTPWCRVLLEKLTGLQLVKKFPVFYGTRRFITAFTSARHLSLSPWSTVLKNFLVYYGPQ